MLIVHSSLFRTHFTYILKGKHEKPSFIRPTHRFALKTKQQTELPWSLRGGWPNWSCRLWRGPTSWSCDSPGDHRPEGRQEKQEELQSCSLWNKRHIHRKRDKMKRHRAMYQMMEQDKTPEKQLNEVEIGKLIMWEWEWLSCYCEWRNVTR